MRATVTGYSELHKLIGDGDVQNFERLIKEGINILMRAFETLENPAETKKAIVDLTLSEDLERWRARRSTQARAYSPKQRKRFNNDISKREAAARGFDPAALMHDFVFSNPQTDIVDVGSDLYNSELANSVLGTADVTDTGIVTEEALQRVYDAHGFLRRALLGFSKVRRTAGGQREADLEEAFDVDFRTTGFSRHLATACNGLERCDQVQQRAKSSSEQDIFDECWWLLSGRLLQYVTAGVVSEVEEDEIAEELRITMAVMYAHGLVDDLAWSLAHASHHAWQVNRLFEAAMWGSFLDDGNLRGRLDRKE
ncbi:hypothetical protein P168DRAFT_317832 [Aspergillus campestris IBT 28561]|uniref:Uncharacterized protein n=1 Tax=Aspergillus campestris (strain IBT 28561) TaxID=1392248 RepID=A0A2I1D4J1_ASPC2|nr:uncharacterized protein P168DRAFT_317832 [Aspergillus campestris IBT 28561]PKY04785.1 hypothetical protein P168DRAFT_317832 [Aspergillus campestris IBT 28561]